MPKKSRDSHSKRSSSKKGKEAASFSSSSGSEPEKEVCEKALTYASEAPAASSSVAAAAVPAGPQITVIVKAPSGRALPITMSAASTVGELRKRAAEATGIALFRAILIKGGKSLETLNASLVESGISNESTVSIREAEAGPTFEIVAKMESGKCFQVSITDVDSIATLRSRVATQAEVSSSRVGMSFRGVELRDVVSCGEAGLSQECVVKISLGPEPVAETPQKGPVAEVSEEKRREVLNSFAASAAGKPIDILFCFDTTGSMYSCLQQVRDNVRTCSERLVREIPDIQIAIMGIGDYCDANTYVTKHIDFTNNAKELSSFAMRVSATGGGDAPEAYEWGLHVANTELSWRKESSKALVMIGDCEPHAPSYTSEKVFWKDEVDKLANSGVKIYGVHAMNNGGNSRDFYEEMAKRSGGVYLNFTNFSLITDMFLAVCFREANKEKLAEYAAEVKQDGRMTEAMSEMMTQLEKPNLEKEEAPKNDRPTKSWEWWDPRNDKGEMQYRLVMGKWVEGSSATAAAVVAARRACSIM